MTRKEEFINSTQPDSFWNILGKSLNEEIFEGKDIEVWQNSLCIGKFLRFELISFDNNLVSGAIHYSDNSFIFIDKENLINVANDISHAAGY